jgi:FtsP/CotA-like multicopper oxidase with cupredoxin domain
MKRLIGRILKIMGLALIMIVVIGGSVLYVAARRSIIPDNINMSSDMAGMDMSNMQMTTPGPDSISLTSLVAGESDAPVKTFNLITQTAKIDIGNGKTVNAYTYNGTLPGPEIRVQQGDMVVVNLVNKLPVSTSIHWHGISVPNAELSSNHEMHTLIRPLHLILRESILPGLSRYWNALLNTFQS